MRVCRDAVVQHGMDVLVVNVTKGSRIPEQVAQFLAADRNDGGPSHTTVHTTIMLGWGSGGTSIEKEFGRSAAFREAVVPWVETGGNLVIQGGNIERYGNWPTWFGKRWRQHSYYRTDFQCFAVPNSTDSTIPHWCKWYHKVRHAIKDKYNVKGILIADVDPDEILFGTTEGAKTYNLVPHMRGQDIDEGLASTAYGKCKGGTVSFVGDVNWEGGTILTMAILARGKPFQYAD